MDLQLVSAVLAGRVIEPIPIILTMVEKSLARIGEEGVEEWDRISTYNSTFRNAIKEIYLDSK